MTPATTRSLATRWITGLAACAACLLVIYRVQVFSGGRWLLGDVVDARIAMTLGEHWFNVLRGMEVWNQPLYFFPASDVLGYNDGYFLYGLAFAGYRALGADVFLAGEASGATFRAVGFGGMLAFAALACRLPYRAALLAAVLATLADALYLQVAHIQLVMVGLAPVLGVLVFLTLRDLTHPDAWGASIAWSCLAALLFDAWLLTGFYTAWFTALFALFAAAATLVTAPRQCWAWLRTARLSRLLPAAALFASGLAPFALVYLPKAQETGMHAYQVIAGLTPTPADLLHVGSGNLLFGWLDRLVTPPGADNFSEHTVGFTPTMLGFALAGAVLAMRNGSPAPRWRRAVAIAFLLSLVVCMDYGGSSPWWLVYQFVPGAAAVRVVTRYWLLLEMPAALLAALAFERLTRHWRRAAVLALAVVLAAGEVTTDGAFLLDRTAERGFIAAVPPAPAGCTAFFVQTARTGEPGYYPLAVNVDGMLLAELLHLPTPNGHASFLPPGFGMGYATAAQYADTAPRALRVAGLERGMCGLDLQRDDWSTTPFPSVHLALGAPVRFGRGGDATALLLDGWSGAEPNGRWTDAAVAELEVQADAPAAGLILTLRAQGFDGLDGASPVDVQVDGQTVAHWTPGLDWQDLRATIPARLVGPGGLLRIRLLIARPVSPSSAGKGNDARELGLFVDTLRLDAAVAAR